MYWKKFLGIDEFFAQGYKNFVRVTLMWSKNLLSSTKFYYSKFWDRALDVGLRSWNHGPH